VRLSTTRWWRISSGGGCCRGTGGADLAPPLDVSTGMTPGRALGHCLIVRQLSAIARIMLHSWVPQPAWLRLPPASRCCGQTRMHEDRVPSSLWLDVGPTGCPVTFGRAGPRAPVVLVLPRSHGHVGLIFAWRHATEYRDSRGFCRAGAPSSVSPEDSYATVGI